MALVEIRGEVVVVGTARFPARPTADGGLAVAEHPLRAPTLIERERVLAVVDGIGAGSGDSRGRRLARLLAEVSCRRPTADDAELEAALEAVVLHLAGATLSGSVDRTTVLMRRFVGRDAATITAAAADRLAEQLAAQLTRTEDGWTSIRFPPAPAPPPGQTAAAVRDHLAALLLARAELPLEDDVAAAVLGGAGAPAGEDVVTWQTDGAVARPRPSVTGSDDASGPAAGSALRATGEPGDGARSEGGFPVAVAEPDGGRVRLPGGPVPVATEETAPRAPLAARHAAVPAAAARPADRWAQSPATAAPWPRDRAGEDRSAAAAVTATQAQGHRLAHDDRVELGAWVQLRAGDLLDRPSAASWPNTGPGTGRAGPAPDLVAGPSPRVAPVGTPPEGPVVRPTDWSDAAAEALHLAADVRGIPR